MKKCPLALGSYFQQSDSNPGQLGLMRKHYRCAMPFSHFHLSSRIWASRISASVVNVSQMLGAVVSGLLAGTVGYRKVIFVSSIFMTVGWAFIGLSDGDFSLIMAGRLIHGGFFIGSLGQVYLSEITDAERR